MNMQPKPMMTVAFGTISVGKRFRHPGYNSSEICRKTSAAWARSTTKGSWIPMCPNDHVVAA